MLRKDVFDFLPVMLYVSGKNILIAGAGNVAQRKIELLLHYNVSLTVVSRDFTSGIKDFANNFPQKVFLIQGEFDLSYLVKDEYVLVIAATDDPELNDTIALECEKQGVLSNVITSVDTGQIIMPAVVRHDDFQIAVSSNGKHPSLAKGIKNLLQEEFLRSDIFEKFLLNFKNK